MFRPIFRYWLCTMLIELVEETEVITQIGHSFFEFLHSVFVLLLGFFEFVLVSVRKLWHCRCGCSWRSYSPELCFVRYNFTAKTYVGDFALNQIGFSTIVGNEVGNTIESVLWEVFFAR